MKSFVYGIDGADERIFDYFNMPFYKNLKSNFSSLPICEDIINRGWSEILTGAEGKDTSGLYISPKLDGTANFSMSYSMADVPKYTGIDLLWNSLGEDVKVGVMNVPSLNPVPAVNGFCIGSAGAGITRVEAIDERLAYPESVADYLNEAGYVPDIRLGPSGITDIDLLFEKLKSMEKTRVDCFIDLAFKYEIDFGFLVDRGTTVVQYLFMSEIKALMDRDSGSNLDFEPSRKIESLLRDFYSFVDDNIKRLYETLTPHQFIVVGDHGHEPMTHHCNPNAILKEGGYFFSGKGGDGSAFGKFFVFLIGSIPRKYRARIRNKLSSSFTSKVERLGTGFDKQATLAFSHWYMPGIYINDNRFYNRVSDKDKKKLVEEICEYLNSNQSSIEHGVMAFPYREKFSKSQYSEKLPDIRLDLPDYMFTLCKSKSYISENDNFGPVTDLSKVQSDMHTGTKGRAPLCLVDPVTASLFRETQLSDLTVVYRLVKTFFEKTSAS